MTAVARSIPKLVAGPVTENMKLALSKTYAATPAPKFVIAVGACATSGGPFVDHAEQHNGCDTVLPVDLSFPVARPTPSLSWTVFSDCWDGSKTTITNFRGLNVNE